MTEKLLSAVAYAPNGHNVTTYQVARPTCVYSILDYTQMDLLNIIVATHCNAQSEELRALN